jgi:hypothetical protein
VYVSMVGYIVDNYSLSLSVKIYVNSVIIIFRLLYFSCFWIGFCF